jgi:hypothetical protein
VILVAGPKPFQAALAEPILVDLVPAREIATGRPSPQSELAEPSQTPESKPSPDNASRGGPDTQAAAAARLAWMLDLPTGSLTSLGNTRSEFHADLPSEVIEKFKERVRRCFVAPPGIHDSGLRILMRVALNPNGTLALDPLPIAPPALEGGPQIAASARLALRQCQPYDVLPANRYKDWKILDVSFTADGPSPSSGRPGAGPPLPR